MGWQIERGPSGLLLRSPRLTLEANSWACSEHVFVPPPPPPAVYMGRRAVSKLPKGPPTAPKWGGGVPYRASHVGPRAGAVQNHQIVSPAFPAGTTFRMGRSIVDDATHAGPSCGLWLGLHPAATLTPNGRQHHLQVALIQWGDCVPYRERGGALSYGSMSFLAHAHTTPFVRTHQHHKQLRPSTAQWT